jgi:hypothetical protein
VSAWLLALALSVGLVALSYAPALRDGGRVWLPALLRGVGALLLAAAAFDAPLGRAGAPAPLVALDASASWTRAAAGDALAAARDSATRAAPGAVLLAGDSLRGGDPRGAGSDAASRAADAVDRAAAAGRPLVYVTDGEADDAAALARAPRGSRAVVVRPARGADAALADADAPRAAAARDTVELRATVAADAAGAGAGEVTAGLGSRVLARTPLAALAPYGRREVRLRVPLAGAAPGPAALTLAVRAAGDREPRNDTLALALDVTDAPAAVFVSGAPDYDARFLLGVLRGALALPVRAYLRVAPGQWRAEGTLAAVSEAEVRAAAARASLLVLHGDTLVLGAPRALGRGALALVAPPAAGAEPGAEWYAAGAPPSPVAGALAGVAWDSLPPLDVGAAPAGEWQALVARAGRRGPPRAVVAGSDAARRTLVAGAGGFWRWQFRGGRTADAAAALVGRPLRLARRGPGRRPAGPARTRRRPCGRAGALATHRRRFGGAADARRSRRAGAHGHAHVTLFGGRPGRRVARAPGGHLRRARARRPGGARRQRVGGAVAAQAHRGRRARGRRRARGGGRTPGA